MTEGTPPRDTLVVVGGRPLTRVDADAVLGAAALVDEAAEGLRAAAAGCWAVSGALRRSLWAPDPSAAPFSAEPDPADAAARARTADLAAAAATRLGERGEAADLLGLRLRLAAGLYRRGESAADRLLGALTATVAAGVGRVVDTHVLPAARLGFAVAGPRDAPEVDPEGGVDDTGDRPAPDWSTPASPADGVPTADGGTLAAAWRAVAPLSDEAVAGLARGVSPFGGVTGGAAELAGLVRTAAGRTDVEVLPLPAAGAPAWAARPAGTVAEALARTADLYPHGSGIPGRPGVGAPAGTLAVERVSRDDGSASWTVLVPGTQGLLAADHPFDGLTDLELMAHQAAEVSEAITLALEEAGAAPDEPVVLVGHSLGGISAVALAASPTFRRQHPVGGVVTAGAPTATFTTPPGVPVLHLENDEELVSPTDGRSSAENPATDDRVTVGRALRASDAAADRAASGSIALAHAMPTHLRTLAAAGASGNVQVAGVTRRIERLLGGDRSRTSFFAARRVPGPPPGPVVMAPGPARARGTTTPPPGVPTGASLH